MIHNISIKNKELIQTLNEISKLHKLEDFIKNVRCFGNSEKENRDYYTGNEYRDKIINMGTKHDGFPEVFYGYDYRIHSLEHQSFTRNSDKIWCVDFMKRVSKLNEQLMKSLCTKGHALSVAYPPGGFISWHNNANASAFNLIFSWSETGDSYFKYIDPETKEEVIVNDVPGWQCKAGYFGSYDDSDKLLYHAASTNCWRVTWSYIFDHLNGSKFAQEEIIEEISTE